MAEALKATQVNASPQTEQALRLAIADDRLRMTIQSGTGADTAAAWNPVRGQIAVSATHGDVALWDSVTGRVTQLLSTGGELPVDQLIYDASGSRLAAVTLASTVAVWDISAAGVATAVPTTSLGNAIRAELAPDIRTLGIGTDSRAGRLGRDGRRGTGRVRRPLENVLIFNLATGLARPLFRAEHRRRHHGLRRPEPGRISTARPRADHRLRPRSGPGRHPPGIAVADHRRRHGPPARPAGSPMVRPWSPPRTPPRAGRRDLQHDDRQGRKPDMEGLPTRSTAMACSANADDQWVAAGDSRATRFSGSRTAPVSRSMGTAPSITSIASSPDGRYLATASAGRHGTDLGCHDRKAGRHARRERQSRAVRASSSRRTAGWC